MGAPVETFNVGGGEAIIGFIVVGNEDCVTGDVVGDLEGTPVVAFKDGGEVMVAIGFVVVGNIDCVTGDVVREMVDGPVVAFNVGGEEVVVVIGVVVVGNSECVIGDVVGVGDRVVELFDALGAIDGDAEDAGCVVSGTAPVTSLIVCSVFTHNWNRKIPCWALVTSPSFEIPLMSIPGIDGHP